MSKMRFRWRSMTLLLVAFLMMLLARGLGHPMTKPASVAVPVDISSPNLIAK